jgi:molybdopterin converting factor small subunit
MEIEVKLFATLRDYLPKGSDQFSCKFEINSADTVRNNGVHSTPEQVLERGDVLSVFPPVAGG